ncbi:MAG: translation elongation factor Ts [Caldiserica bacterium]|nr:translation elongation factor Ts [Caldisericota bacterium]
MKSDVQKVKELREKTGAGVLECKKALEEANGDIEKAVEVLRKKGMDIARKKSQRSTREGLIASYIHFGGKIGVLVEVNCETDFVARTEEFKELVKNITMQIAASSPRYVSREEIPQEIIEKEKQIYLSQFANRPPQVQEKIAQGKLEKFFSEVCLMEQPFIRDSGLTVKEYVESVIGKLGENIRVKRFIRYQLGEEE